MRHLSHAWYPPCLCCNFPTTGASQSWTIWRDAPWRCSCSESCACAPPACWSLLSSGVDGAGGDDNDMGEMVGTMNEMSCTYNWQEEGVQDSQPKVSLLLQKGVIWPKMVQRVRVCMRGLCTPVKPKQQDYSQTSAFSVFPRPTPYSSQASPASVFEPAMAPWNYARHRRD